MLKICPLQDKWNWIVLGIAALITASDQWTKWLIQNSLYLGQSVPETGFFRLTYVQNTGAAFSIFTGLNDILAVFAIVGAILILTFIFFLSRRFPFLDTRLNKLALSLILAGTIGNLIDRLWLGYVRDFIDVSIWPIFNIADSSTVVGTLLFAFSLLFLTRETGIHKTQTGAGPASPQPPPEAQ
ncbi:MAG TPA: signal peptidase II [Dehalococcoidales bacterium]|nr:signal peptidase II [Dehalococcoidales bacterium]